jgi:hypothetical protein
MKNIRFSSILDGYQSHKILTRTVKEMDSDIKKKNEDESFSETSSSNSLASLGSDKKMLGHTLNENVS